MPIETLDDIVEEIMDRLGVYGAHPEDAEEDTLRECQCRYCQAASLKARIIDAAEVERKLNDVDGETGTYGGRP